MRRPAFLAALAAALPFTALPAASQTRATLTVATIANESLSEVFYALDMGFFERAGLDVNLQVMNNGPAITAAVVSGAVDVGGSNLISLVQAYKRGIPVTLVAPAALYDHTKPMLAVLVRKDSPIKTASDLEGKTVAASPLKSISQWGADAWIDASGGDSSQVKWVELTSAQMGPALLEGRVDAVVDAEPFLTQDRPNARFVADPYPAVGLTFLTSAYFTTTQWAKAHPDLVQRFAAVLHETAAWANKNHVASGDILAKYTKIDRTIIEKMTRVKYADRLIAAQIQPNIALAVKYKAIDAGFPAQEMIYQP